jgi:hypothetical protein
LPKYRSRTSTYRWTISKVINSLSSDSIPVIKNKEAYLHQSHPPDEYLRYTTLVSIISTHEARRGAFVFEEVAHFGSSGKDQLSDVLDDFGLLLLRKGDEPFR